MSYITEYRHGAIDSEEFEQASRDEAWLEKVRDTREYDPEELEQDCLEEDA